MKSTTNRIFGFAVAVSFLFACGNASKQSPPAADAPKDSGNAPQTEATGQEWPAKAVADKLKPVLLVYFAKDLSFMSEADRKYSFFETDLNDDGKNEYFIRLQGTYFCGSGGCNFLLLDSDLKPVERFTVMRGPIFRSATVTDGWHDLIVYGQNGDDKKTYRHLKWDKKQNRYPTNPSLVPENDQAPGDKDFVMWDEVSNGRAEEFDF